MSKIEKLIEKLKNNPTDIRFDELRKILEMHDYILSNSKGSHMRFIKTNAPAITIATHGGKVKKWYVKDVIKLLSL